MLGVLDVRLPNPKPVLAAVVVVVPPKLNEGVVDDGCPKLNPVCPNAAVKDTLCITYKFLINCIR